MIKKVLSLMMCAALIIGMIPCVFAANDATVTAETVSVQQGTATADVKIDVANNPGVVFAKFKVTYPSELTLTSVADGGLLGNATHSNNRTSPYVLYWNNGTAEVDYTANGTVATLKFDIDANAQPGKYPITVEVVQNDTFNYNDDPVNFTAVNGSVTITEKPKEDMKNLTFADDTVTYDGTAKSLEVAGTLPQGADIVYTSADFDADGKAINAGTYNVKATVTAPGYNTWEKEAVLTINPKEVTVTGLTAADKTYDGTTDATLSGGELSGKVEGDNLSVAEYPTVGTFASKDAGNNIAVTFADIVLSGEDKANYTLTQPTVTADINKVAITVTGKKYAIKAGSALPNLAEAYEITSGALVGEDAFTGSVATNADNNTEGTYKITQGTLTLGANYDLTFIDGEIAVSLKTPQSITVSELPAKTYGDDGFTIEVTPDEASGLDTFTFASSDENVATVSAEGVVAIVGAGEADITVRQAGNDEYAAFEKAQKLTVAQKEVSVTTINLDEKTAVLDGVLEADLEYVEADFSNVALEIIPTEDEEPAEGEAPVAPTTADVKVSGLALKGDKAANYKLADAEIQTTVALENVVNVEITASNGTVTGDGAYLVGAAVTVTATADEGYNFSGWYVEDEKVSEDAEYTFTAEADVTLTAKFTKKTTTTTGGGGGLSAGGDKSTAGADNLGNTDKEEITAPEETPVVTPIAPAGGFGDLGNHAWAADAITKLVEQGVIKGTSATTYSPANNIIRADFAALIVRMFNLSSANEENFDDVAATDYFASELAIARNTNVVNGIGNNKFAPRSSISRQDMMVMIYRAMTTLGVELEPAGESYATDFDTVSDYAKEAVSVLMANGIINGKNGKVDPIASATRAEVAVMLSRVLDLVK